ncbi:MAG: dienelactone hydrolase family protein [Gemmatimonadales bacterium]
MRNGAVSTLMVAASGLVAGALSVWLVGAPMKAGAMGRDSVTTHGEWVKFANAAGDSVRAYVAYPERKDKAPAVIVIHEIFGLTDWEPTVADKLAGQGYVAVVPDLLSSRFGMSPASGDSGRKLVAQLSPDGVNADLDAAYAYLNTLPAVKKDHIGTIGFCWGGARSFRYATANPKLKAAVICYGSAPDSALMPNIKAKLLGVYGEEDARINAALPDVTRQLKQAKVKSSYDIYPGTGHGFLKPGRKGSDGPAVEQAWARILEFYKKSL